MTQEPEVQFITYPAPVYGASYPLPWRYLAASEHEVVFDDSAGEVLQTLVSGVGYTITPDADTGANVGALTLIAAPTPEVAGLTITRNATIEQIYRATPGAEGVEAALDRTIVVLQDQHRRIQRVPQLPPGTTLDGAAMPNPVAGRLLLGRADEKGWETAPFDADDIAQAQGYALRAEGALAAFDAITMDDYGSIVGGVTLMADYGTLN